MQAEAERTELRLDKWLVYARFCKTRGQAAQIVDDGKIRVNGRKIEKPDTKLRVLDVLTLASPSGIQLISVLQLAQRRGSPHDAAGMYEILPQSGASLE